MPHLASFFLKSSERSFLEPKLSFLVVKVSLVWLSKAGLTMRDLTQTKREFLM